MTLNSPLQLLRNYRSIDHALPTFAQSINKLPLSLSLSHTQTLLSASLPLSTLS